MNEAKPFCISKKEVWKAYQRVKVNQGGAGIDEQTIEDFEKRLKKNLYKIWNRMSSGSYFPPPVRTVKIPKASGGEPAAKFPGFFAKFVPASGGVNLTMLNIIRSYYLLLTPVDSQWLTSSLVPACLVRDRGFSPAHRAEREKPAGKHRENITQNNAAGYNIRRKGGSIQFQHFFPVDPNPLQLVAPDTLFGFRPLFFRRL